MLSAASVLEALFPGTRGEVLDVLDRRCNDDLVVAVIYYRTVLFSALLTALADLVCLPAEAQRAARCSGKCGRACLCGRERRFRASWPRFRASTLPRFPCCHYLRRETIYRLRKRWECRRAQR
jgi:hypothetical protein